jgi:hypothetical protein
MPRRRLLRIGLAVGVALVSVFTANPVSRLGPSNARVGPFQFTLTAHAAGNATVTQAEAEAAAIANLVNVNNITGWKVEAISFQTGVTQATDFTTGDTFFQSYNPHNIFAMQLVAAGAASGQSNVVAVADAVVDGDTGSVMASATNVDTAPTVDDTGPAPVSVPVDTGWVQFPMPGIPENYCAVNNVTAIWCTVKPCGSICP